jgi:hypothetical protein
MPHDVLAKYKVFLDDFYFVILNALWSYISLRRIIFRRAISLQQATLCGKCSSLRKENYAGVTLSGL